MNFFEILICGIYEFIMNDVIAKMNKDLISVIVPVYNAGKSLSACMECLLGQTYGNIEILLSDDGSTDGSGKLCDGYAARDSRIKVIHRQNGGPASARNAALDAASGDFIAFADSDDSMEKDMLEYLHGLATRHNAEIAACSYYKNGIESKSLFNEEKSFSCDEALEKLYSELYIWNKLFSRKAAGKTRFNKDIFVGEDMVYCLEVFKNNSIAYGPEPKYHYTFNAQGLTKQPFNERKLTYFNATDKMLEYARAKGLSSLERRINNERTYHAIGYLRQIADSANYRELMQNGNGKAVSFLLSIARKGITRYMSSGHKISSKMFGLASCVNYGVAAAAYRFITGKNRNEQ